MGRSVAHICSRHPYTFGRIVTAYVRLGTPSKWIAVGKVCADCKAFFPPLPGMRY
jgi:hypothetical protein